MRAESVGVILVAAVASLAPAKESHAALEASSLETDPQRPPVVATRPGSSVEYDIGDALNLAYVQRDRLESVDVYLKRRRSRFTGRIGRQRLEANLKGSRIVGLIGERAIALRAMRADGHLRIDGMFGTRAIALTVDPRALVGQVGLCTYELSQLRGAYVGRVFCGGGPLPVRLTIPVSMAAREDVELSLMLTALLVR